jgi:CheY-like chemotaxis protein
MSYMGCRTLIVEDDPQSRRVLTQLLTLLGYETDSAATLAEAEQKMRWAHPDCLILDLELPDGNGLTLLAQLRKNQCDVKVAITSAAREHSLLNRMLQLHPDAVFPKPIDLRALTRWLDEHDSSMPPNLAT